MTIPSIRLNDSHSIPQLGFGVFRISRAQTEQVVTTALEAGYRHFDTATFYGNESELGAALAKSGIPRDELFVTTKLWNADQGPDKPFAAIDRSLDNLGLGHVDLYLIHWPVPSADLYVDTWRALESIKDSGKATSIGVSNFRIQDLQRLATKTTMTPAVNQIEVHPLLIQKRMRAYHSEHGIVTESWGPLGEGAKAVLAAPRVAEIAADHGVTPAQVILRWHIQHGLVAIPKSSNPDRMRQNIDLFGFDLDGREMTELDAMDSATRFGPDPATL